MRLDHVLRDDALLDALGAAARTSSPAQSAGRSEDGMLADALLAWRRHVQR